MTMILTWFKPLLRPRPTTLGCALSRLAYPLDGRIPDSLDQLLQRLDRR